MYPRELQQPHQFRLRLYSADAAVRSCKSCCPNMPGALWWQRGKIAKEKRVQKDIATTYLAQEDAFGGIIEEVSSMQRKRPAAPEQHTEYTMPETGQPTTQ